MRYKLIFILLLVSLSLLLFGQNVGPKKCKVCGKPFAQCQYRGKHPQKTENDASSKPESQSSSKSSKPTNSKPSSSSQRQKATTATYSDGILTCNGVRYKMIRVEGGTFTMGATSEQGSDARDSEKPAHQVTLSTFSIGETEVTQELWKAVMGSNPSRFKGAKLPVEQVSWNDCQEFIFKLNSLTGWNFRLPTEAEWEYAARGGNRSQGYKYCGSNLIDDVAWYLLNSGDQKLSDDFRIYQKIRSNHCKTHQVAQKKPNELGLYDMSGNVKELCNDWIGSYGNSHQQNPQGPDSGVRYRVARGGSWATLANDCRLSYRDLDVNGSRGSMGFRIAFSDTPLQIY